MVRAELWETFAQNLINNFTMERFQVWKLYAGIVKTSLRKLFLRRGTIHRTKAHVTGEYTKVWEDARDAVRGRGARLQKLHGRLILCRSIDHRAFFMEHFSHILSSLRPESVLEMGSGNGFNLLALAVMHPEIKTFRGVELTDAGVATFQMFLKNPPVEDLVYVTGHSEAVVRERLSGRDIRCVKGDMLKLPFPENTFSLVFTCWALEQIPDEYPTAFAEAHRVSKRHAVFFEAFYEAQENIFQLLHLKNLDYFHAPIHDVKKTGFEILSFEPMALSKIKFTTGALLAEKRSSTE